MLLISIWDGIIQPLLLVPVHQYGVSLAACSNS